MHCIKKYFMVLFFWSMTVCLTICFIENRNVNILPNIYLCPPCKKISFILLHFK